MSMLVSDYDGTFEGNGLNFKLNCEKVQEFINLGNTFVLASSVPCEILIKLAQNLKIPYSFLAGNNGICDHNQQMICSTGNGNGFSKTAAVNFLESELGVNYEEIFTIGNDTSDYGMIDWWNGFHIGTNKQLSEISLGQYSNVHELIDDIIKKKVKKR